MPSRIWRAWTKVRDFTADSSVVMLKRMLCSCCIQCHRVSPMFEERKLVYHKEMLISCLRVKGWN